MAKNILVIRLGALGDILLSMQAFQDIRKANPGSRIDFLTQPAFAGLARRMPWFDQVHTDVRAPFYRIDQWLAVGKIFGAGAYDLVIDLQNKPRTSLYYHLFYQVSGKAWSGCATNAFFTYPHPLPSHHFDKTIAQIRSCHILDSGALDMGWMHEDISSFHLPARYAVLIPGCAPHRPEKRWPATHFAELARLFKEQGCQPVLVGTKSDANAIENISSLAPYATSLCGQTSFQQLASLFRGAVAVVGNDTGPTHLAALVGAPTLAVMSAATNPAQTAPRGPRASYLLRQDLGALSAKEAYEAVCGLLHQK